MEKPRSILFITSRSDMGGGPKHLEILVKNLRALEPGLKIHIACPEDGVFAGVFRNMGLPLFPIPARKFSLKSLLELRKYCLDNGIDIVHSHGMGAGVFSRLLGLYGLKVVHTFHGVHNDSSLKSQLKVLFEKYLRPLADRYITVSEDERNKAMELGLIKPENFILIENGIEVSGQIADGAGYRERFSEYDILLGTLARYDKVKGVEQLIKNFKVFRDSHKDKSPVLLIAGGGHPPCNEDDVVLLGEINDPENFLSALDIYVSNSQREGMPLSVLEATRAGKPCLLSNVIGHKNLAQKLPNCLLFDFDSAEQFGEGADQLLSIAGIREDGIEAIRKNFSSRSMASRTLELYGELS